jgi:hypothetical protein
MGHIVTYAELQGGGQEIRKKMKDLQNALVALTHDKAVAYMKCGK